MSEYSPSTATRQALINAAGALFAEHGLDGVTTRDIAEAAGENKGLIHYHFGGKDGLVNAVIEYAGQSFENDPMGHFLTANERLLETQEGQERLVGGLIDILFDVICSKTRPEWCNTLVFRVLQKEVAISDKTFAMCVKPSLGVFMRLYEMATGDDDPVNSFSWADVVIAPIVLQAINPNVPKRFFKNGKTPERYITLLREMSKNSAISWLRKVVADRKGALK